MCSSCNLRELCAPCCGLTRAEMGYRWPADIRCSRLQRGEILYRSGDRFTSLYAVRDGFFKATALIENGREQVTGFAMAGEVLGMDGIAPERHTCTATALEDSEVCAILFSRLQQVAQAIPSLQHQFHRMMSL